MWRFLNGNGVNGAGQWGPIGVDVTSIAANGDGALYALNTAGGLYRFHFDRGAGEDGGPRKEGAASVPGSVSGRATAGQV